MFFVSLVGSPVQVGQSVTARILDIVKSDGIVDLSLRADIVESETLAKTPTKKTVRKVPKLITFYAVGSFWPILPKIIVEPVICSFLLEQHPTLYLMADYILWQSKPVNCSVTIEPLLELG